MANKITAKLLEQIIEAALLVSGKPISVSDVKSYFGEEDVVPHSSDIRQVFQKLVRRYKARGIELKEVASGFRFQVAENVAPYVIKQWEERPPRYSRALLETLALIAYRQPITRGDIEDIRGVAVSSNIIRTLLEREWVRVVGHKDVPGRPALYATTSKFLDYFNLKSLTELPELSEVKDLESINPELDFGEAFGLVAESEDENASFDGESADLIPDAEAPTDQAIDEVSEEDRERIRLAKEEANKEAEYKREMAAREELRDIDRYNSAIEKMIRSPDAQRGVASAAQEGDLSDDAVQQDAVQQETGQALPEWLAAAKDAASGASTDTPDDGLVEKDVLTIEHQADSDTLANSGASTGKSRFAQLADRLEASVAEVEQKELLAQEQAESDFGDVSLDESSDLSEAVVSENSGVSELSVGGQQEVAAGAEVTTGAGVEATPTETVGGDMSEEEIEQFIQRKLAEQAALLDKSNSDDESEE
ncbi:SMC-Scp complex subunit ScpB [Litoribacillus peritrichatus]|uniref:SMC-Scp complex subunit ScpB n=1 Tax=Litoribacillus peritrichatus TaxID=718191 RepID=A0ABP7M9K2_9GAMM